MTEEAANRRKWWLEATYVTAISAAIIVPSVTLLDHWLDYKLEAAKQEHALHLDEQKQSHEIRQTYLDRAIDPHRTADYRRSVLSFLTETLDEKEPMKGWAKEELARLEQALKIEAKLAAAEMQAKSLQQQLAQARVSASRSSGDVRKLAQDLKAAEIEVGSLQKELEAAKSKANIAPTSSLPPGRPNDSPGEDASAQGGREQVSESGAGGSCCITCAGIIICGKFVSTPCGSCDAGGL